MKPTIVLDFDGVLHSYESGWHGPRTIPDPPVDGAIDFLLELLADGCDVVIHSTRSHQLGARRAMKKWIRGWAEEHFKDSATEGGSLEPWFQAGYSPGMDPVNEEAWHAARWLVRQTRWPRNKVPAVAQLDDRAVRFTGQFPKPSELRNFKPWNRA